MKTLLIKLMILGKDAQEKNRSWFLEWILHIYIYISQITVPHI